MPALRIEGQRHDRAHGAERKGPVKVREQIAAARRLVFQGRSERRAVHKAIKAGDRSGRRKCLPPSFAQLRGRLGKKDEPAGKIPTGAPSKRLTSAFASQIVARGDLRRVGICADGVPSLPR